SGLFVESFALSVLYGLAILSVALALGALFRRPVVALVATVLLMLFVLPILVFAVEQFGIEPWFLVSYADSALTNVFAPPAHVVTVGGGPGSAALTTYNATIPEAAVIMAAYAIGALLVAVLINQRKEVTG